MISDETKRLIRELYEQASGHVSGGMLMGAIKVAVKERTGVAVTIEDVIRALESKEEKSDE